MSVTRLRPPREPVCPWQLRIELLDVKPAVWRRLVVPSNIRLPALHEVFQIALGWTNSHLHRFSINGVHFAEPDPEFMEELEQEDETRILLGDALGGEARAFEYEYDFGDGWNHAVIVEDLYARTRPRVAVKCLAGENACPPEDVGGPGGYAEFLKAIADPQHERHEEFLDWCGCRFDPAKFDVQAVNRALAEVKL